MRPLKEPEPVSSLWISGRAPALHACEYVSTPAFDTYPFRFAMRGGCGRFLSGALMSAFHPAMVTITEVRFFCKEFAFFKRCRG
jgi:hypothetical protein